MELPDFNHFSYSFLSFVVLCSTLQVVIERAKTIKGVARTLVLCEVEINAVAIPEVPTEEGTEVVDERNYGGPFGQ